MTTFVQGFYSYTSSIDHYSKISFLTKAVVLRILSGILSSSLLEKLSVTMGDLYELIIPGGKLSTLQQMILAGGIMKKRITRRVNVICI